MYKRQVFSLLWVQGLHCGEQQNIADGGAVGQEHDQTVNAEAEAARGGQEMCIRDSFLTITRHENKVRSVKQFGIALVNKFGIIGNQTILRLTENLIQHRYCCLLYTSTIHKAMGSEYETVIMPLLKAHTIMMYRNLLSNLITMDCHKQYLFLPNQHHPLFSERDSSVEQITIHHDSAVSYTHLSLPDGL